jgi:hypothetical protein
VQELRSGHNVTPAAAKFDEQLVAFSANLTLAEAVELKWSTATEKNLSHFEMEKSTDGRNYQQAAIIFAFGNTTEPITYKFTDKKIDASASEVHYRLRAVYNDGTTSLSAVRSIQISKKPVRELNVVTYPNPADSDLRITVPADWKGKKVSYELFYHNGQVAKSSVVRNSRQTEAMSLNSLVPGNYVLKVSCGGESAFQSIVKR